MSSHQQPSDDDFATRRRAPGAQQGGQQSSFGSGFGTQSQWRKPGPGAPQQPSAPQFRNPQFSSPQAYPPQAPGASAPQPQFQGNLQAAPVQPAPYSSAPYSSAPYNSAPYNSAPYNSARYGSAPYGSQFQQPQQYPAPYGQPYGQQPGGYYPQQQSQAPRNKSVLPVVFLCIIAVVALLGVVAFTQGGDENPTIDGKGFKNDDYKVPPASGTHPELPFPKTDAEVKDWLEKNAIYEQELPQPVRCELQDFDHTSATSDEIKVQLEQTLECLVRVWGPSLEAAGFTITHPSVTMYDSPVQGACGKAAMRNAFYCSLDQNLYFATDLHEIFGDKSDDQWAYEAVMAHEFAHSVQGRTGIISARNVLNENETSKDAAYLRVRRTEAQADCMAGLFFNSTQESLGLTTADVTSIQDFYGAIGNKDPNRVSTHPQSPTRFKWFQTGMNNTAVDTCNSHTVPADEVK